MAEKQEHQKRSVLITGCSEGGIGFALAQEFHRRDLRVFATARNLGKVEHLRSTGLEVIQLDVADQASIRAAVETVSKLTGGTLDILINNAGGGYQMTLLDADLDEARRLFDVNLWGLLAVTQAFAPLLAAGSSSGRKSRIVNISSVAARVGVPWQGIYNATKGALFVLTDTLRLELRILGIDVLHVVTGGISSKFYSNATSSKLPATSLYAPIAAEIDADLAGQASIGSQTMTPEAYARKVVSNTLSSWPTTTMWIGGRSLMSWSGDKFLPDSIQDFIVGSIYSLAALKSKYKELSEKTREQGTAV